MIKEIMKVKRITKKDVIKIGNDLFYAKHVVPVVKSLKKHEVKLLHSNRVLTVAYSKGETSGVVEFKALEIHSDNLHIHAGEFKQVWHSKAQTWRKEKAWLKVRNTYPIKEGLC